MKLSAQLESVKSSVESKANFISEFAQAPNKLFEASQMTSIEGQLLIPSQYFFVPKGGVELLRATIETQLRVWVKDFVLSAAQIKVHSGEEVQVKVDGAAEQGGPQVLLLLPSGCLETIDAKSLAKTISERLACEINSIRVLGVTFGSVVVHLQLHAWLRPVLAYFSSFRKSATFNILNRQTHTESKPTSASASPISPLQVRKPNRAPAAPPVSGKRKETGPMKENVERNVRQ